MFNSLEFDLFPDPVGHFALSRQRGVTCSVALQAMSEWPLRRLAGFEGGKNSQIPNEMMLLTHVDLTYVVTKALSDISGG